jgi:hypothetical protein
LLEFAEPVERRAAPSAARKIVPLVHVVFEMRVPTLMLSAIAIAAASTAVGSASHPAAVGSARAAAVSPPAVVFATDAGITVAATDGRIVRNFPDATAYSLDGMVVAGARRSAGGRRDEIVAHDVQTGRRLFRVADAFAPVVVDSGRLTVFLPDRFGRRDRQTNSIWLRDNATGRVRKVVQFSNGPGLPGVRTGLGGEAGPLSMSVDSRGRTIAIAQGNDVDLFRYTVWVVDARTGNARRLTNGTKSRWPFLSPDALRIAVVRERHLCPGGYRAGDVEILHVRRARRARMLIAGDCSTSYSPRGWMTDRRVLAFRMRRASGELRPYRVDIVTIDLETRAVEPLTSAEDVSYLTVSSSRRLVAYKRASADGFFVYDAARATTTHITPGHAPRVAGDFGW